MELTFDAQLVQQLLDDSKQAKSWRLAYGDFSDPQERRPGLWLVGDRGVYLMSNSEDGVLQPDSTPDEPHHVVAYANECNPNGDNQDWYANKRESFGGDDAVEFLAAAFIEGALAQAQNGMITLDVTPTSISV